MVAAWPQDRVHRLAGDQPHVWVVDAAGSNLRRLARTPGLWEYELDWSPSGRIVLSGLTAGYTLRLYVMNSNGSNGRLISPPLRVRADEAMPKWSPDGERSCAGSTTPWAFRAVGHRDLGAAGRPR